MTKTMKYRQRNAVPCDTALILTQPWRHDTGTAPTGTVVQPQSSGNDHTGRHVRRVVIDGQNITGPVLMTPADLRSWRRAQGLSQTQAAAAIGYSLRQWQKFESGEAVIPVTAPVLEGYLRLIEMHRAGQASLQRQIEMMETGQLATREARGGQMVDTTAESLADARRRLAELGTLIAESLRRIGLPVDEAAA